MEAERITLSQRERDRLRVLHEVKQKHLSQVAAAERLKVTDRQVRRMLLRIRERGDGALVHGQRKKTRVLNVDRKPQFTESAKSAHFAAEEASS
jgi:hypothetical protein